MLRPLVGRADPVEGDSGVGRGNHFRRRRQFPAGAVEPVLERPRRHALRRPIVVKTDVCDISPRVRRIVYESEARQLRGVQRGRHGPGHDGRRAGADFRAVLHHQAGGQGHGARLVMVHGIVNSTRAPSTSTASPAWARRSRSTCRSSSRPTLRAAAAQPSVGRRQGDNPRGRGRSDGPRRGPADSRNRPATRSSRPPTARRPWPCSKPAATTSPWSSLDGVMPKLGGIEVYRRIKDDWPEMRVIFCSGYDPETARRSYR